MKKFLWLGAIAFFQLHCGSDNSSNEQGGSIAPVADTVLVKGKDLFVGKCASCHMVNKEMTGPALRGVEDRWSDKQKLYAFIRNSQEVIEQDPYAHDLWLQFNQTAMPEHKDLVDDDIASILYYINKVTDRTTP